MPQAVKDATVWEFQQLADPPELMRSPAEPPLSFLPWAARYADDETSSSGMMAGGMNAGMTLLPENALSQFE
jgi:hypothetical protein